MRFVVSGEMTRNRLLQVIVVLFIIYVALLWVTNAVLYFQKMGLGPQSVVEYYLGSEERFLQPRSFQGMVEVAHFHMFAMGMLLMTLTHLMLFVPLSWNTKAVFVIVPFFAALLDEGAGWLVRFVWPGFAILKVGGFLLLETSLAVLMVTCLWACFGGTNAAYAGRDEDDDEDDL